MQYQNTVLIEKKPIEEVLRHSTEAEFRLLCEALPVGIVKVDPEGRLTYINPRALAICGYTSDEVLGYGWRELVHPEDLERYQLQWNSTDVVKEFSADVRYVHRDGAIRFSRVKTSAIFGEHTEVIGYVAIIEDVTEMRSQEKMKLESVSIVSHELRTPLAVIRTALGLLSTGVLQDEPETAQQMLKIAALDTERLVRLVDNILDQEQLESHQIHMIQQWCDADQLMRQSIESLQPLAEENNISLLLTPLSVQIYVDADRIIQILVNLVSNAIKFSSPGGHVCLIANLLLETTHEDINIKIPCVLFQVQDQGRGIPAHKLEIIFEPFQQVDASDSRQKRGIGLGLAICRSIVQLHGGQIWVESVLGKGSTFYFTVPL